MDGPHNTYNSVWAAADASMGPKMDLAVTGVTVTNPSAQDGYVRGDLITVSASATNVGGLDYTDGGNLEIIYMDGNNPIVVATKQLTNIQVQGSMTHTASVDTTCVNLPTNAWSTALVQTKRITWMEIILSVTEQFKVQQYCC